MCGIAGIVVREGPAARESAVMARMVKAMRHRGGDEEGVHIAGRCALGHARLSIVDIATGRQPMSNEDGTVWVTFNGEIYNHPELRRDLEARGHRFATRSDTEVLVHLYEEYGPALVDRLNGQWALAIWDATGDTLFLSRDRLGVRPLYYTRTAAGFLFASEIKALFCHPSVPRQLDLRAIDDVFTIWSIVPPRTAFEGVFELPPGHSLTLRGDRVDCVEHFRLRFQPGAVADARAEADLARELLDRLAEAARLRFVRADVPVCSYLSGGLDSTLITAIVQRVSDAPLRTFSVAFEDGEFDESAFQQRARAALGVEHHEVRCGPGDIAACFPDVVWHAEQPIPRTAPAPLFLLSRAVRDAGFKVALTGEGADELFGGYDIFKEAKVRRFLARQPGSAARAQLLRRLYPYMPAMQRQSPAFLAEFFRARPEDLADPFFSHLPRWQLTARNKLFYSPATRGALDGYDTRAAIAATLPAEYHAMPAFCQGQFLETKLLLPGYLLSAQGDRMGMAHSVEGRFPFLDPDVVELAGRIPPGLKMRALKEKYLLRRAAGDLLPEVLRERPKQPYRAPEASSFFDAEGRARSEYVEHMLSERQLRRAGIFNPEPTLRLVAKARAGRANSIKDGMALVSILSTQLLHHNFIETYSTYGNVA